MLSIAGPGQDCCIVEQRNIRCPMPSRRIRPPSGRGRMSSILVPKRQSLWATRCQNGPDGAGESDPKDRKTTFWPTRQITMRPRLMIALTCSHIPISRKVLNRPVWQARVQNPFSVPAKTAKGVAGGAANHHLPQVRPDLQEAQWSLRAARTRTDRSPKTLLSVQRDMQTRIAVHVTTSAATGGGFRSRNRTACSPAPLRGRLLR